MTSGIALESSLSTQPNFVRLYFIHGELWLKKGDWVRKVGPYLKTVYSNLNRRLGKKGGTLIEKEGLTKKSLTQCVKGGL